MGLFELSDEELRSRRKQMVELQLRRRGITNQRVLDQMARVPRHLFVDHDHQRQAYADHPLPIGGGQTISQPYMVAKMTELGTPQPDDRVLEVGAGSGYQTAVLAGLVSHVYSTELLQMLVDRAINALSRIEYDNVTLERRDGSKGWEDHAPFDLILVAAGAPLVPEVLKEQLGEGGRLVIPVGGHGLQMLQCYIRQGDIWTCHKDTACRFVKLRGKFGWDRESDTWLE